MKTYAYFLRYALLALPLVCAFALSSCYNDEDGDCPGGNEPVEVRLNVSAQQIGDLNGTRAGGDGPADEHEFMHSLRVYIVNEAGSVMQSFVHDPAALAGYSTAASTGDLTNWSSESFELAPGEYTVYAFANFEGHEGFADGENSAQLADKFIHTCFPDDGRVNTTALNSFTIADPAGKIKFVSYESGEAVYIPMSAKQTFSVTSNTHDISIGLVRLVGKVQLTVSPDNAEIGQKATVTFSGYSQNVPLMESDQTVATGGNDYIYNTDRSLYGKRDASTGEIPLTGYDPNAGTTYSFYVNETPTPNVEAGEGGFTVTLNTGNTAGGISEYEGTPTRQRDIPRNHVYPLTLTFTQFGIELTPTAWIYILGNYAVDYDVDDEKGIYTIGIAEGSFFNLNATGVTTASGSVSNVEWTWIVPTQEDEGLEIQTNSGGEILGHVPSSVGYKYTLYLNGQWVYNGASYSRTYTVIVDVAHDTEWAMDHRLNGSGTNAANYGGTMRMLVPEYLNMFKAK